MRSTFEHRLTADLRALPALAAELRAWLAHHGVDPQAVHGIDFALEELASNCIRHAQLPSGAQGWIGVRVELTRDAVELRLDDGGAPFDPTRAPAPPRFSDLASATAGGRGLRMVLELTPDLRYERVNERNVVRVRVPRAR